MQSLPWSRTGVQGPERANAELGGFLASRMLVQGIHIKVGDIVQAGHAEDLVIVRGCFARRGCFYLIVDSFSKRRELSPRAWECTVRGP